MVYICVALVIIFIILFASGVCGYFIAENDHNPDSSNGTEYAWLFSSVGFGICLTIVLFQNGYI